VFINMRRLACCLVAFATGLLPAPAQDAHPATPAKPDRKLEEPMETRSSTTHSITIGGAKLDYQATAGTIVLRNDEGKATASVFFVAYTKTNPGDLSKRPVTFTFNGGPGSSSVWLHMGAFGPRRVEVAAGAGGVAPPYRMVDNEYTLLDVTDLVFIDPVTTGYSRAAPGQNAKQFHGVEEDIRSVGEFIRLYTTRNSRWNSPKFLAGESYGTTRAAGLVSHLQDQEGMNFDGVLLISAVLNFQTISFNEGNDLPYILFLPSYTSTAWYHHKLPADLQADRRKALDEASHFASGQYTLALMKGSQLSPTQRAEVVRKLARYTGLSEDYISRANLRVPMGRFAKELLRKEAKVIGRYDSRFTGADLDVVGERSDYDPSYTAVQGPFTAAFNQYVRADLNYKSDLPYEILTARVQPWEFGSARNRYLNQSVPLRQAMTKNPDLRLFVANGYYDLATPYFATEYTVNHLGLDPALAAHITMTYYAAGHMMYIHKPSLEKLKQDAAGFYETAIRKG
jgi:carboxypeptidase C (cathepsin A)